MVLPEFNSLGELPDGIHQATMAAVLARFGAGTRQREVVTARLEKVYRLAQATGKLERFIIFGSYITNKPAPNDVDIILILADDFRASMCDEESKKLFDHREAQNYFGASIFWARPAMLILESVAEFIAHWQIKRDLSKRGIVEVRQ